MGKEPVAARVSFFASYEFDEFLCSLFYPTYPALSFRAFTSEFTAEEGVRLFLRTNPDRDLKAVVKEIAGKEDPRISVLSPQADHRCGAQATLLSTPDCNLLSNELSISTHRYQQMLLAADAFVLATHGEGWGRPLMEGKLTAPPSFIFFEFQSRSPSCCCFWCGCPLSHGHGGACHCRQLVGTHTIYYGTDKHRFFAWSLFC